MSAFITDQLEQMSKKDLLEFAQTAHENNVRLIRRVKELESYNIRLANESHEYQQRCASHEKDMLRQCVFMERTAEKLEQHREWQATASVLRRPTREAKQALNKFALEQKIEELVNLRSSLGCLDNREASKFAVAINKAIEQLRKEQEK
ncbi:MAG: hypothetical protein WA981_03700 [Glaciecola sp.]